MRAKNFVLILVLAACQATPPPSASEAAARDVTTPTASATLGTAQSSTAAPSPVETQAPSDEVATPSPSPAPAVLLEPDGFASVVTNDLRVRSKPGVGEDSIKLEPLLNDGVAALVLDGPVEASGYEWYLIEPFLVADVHGMEELPRLGWAAAASKDGEPWLEEWRLGCPSDPLADLTDGLESISSNWVGLWCFGNEPQTVRAHLGTPEAMGCGAEPTWTVVPGFLDPSCAMSYFLIPVTEPVSYESLRLHVAIDPSVDPPGDWGHGLGPPDEWPLVEVTGQYDHPAARSCRLWTYTDETAPPDPPEITVHRCRATFVVTSLAIVAGG